MPGVVRLELDCGSWHHSRTCCWLYGVAGKGGGTVATNSLGLTLGLALALSSCRSISAPFCGTG